MDDRSTRFNTSATVEGRSFHKRIVTTAGTTRATISSSTLLANVIGDLKIAKSPKATSQMGTSALRLNSFDIRATLFLLLLEGCVSTSGAGDLLKQLN